MRLRALLIVLSLFCTTWTVAQDDAAKAKEDKKPAEKGSAAKTYTKDDLREEVDPSAESPSVISNEDLKKKSGDSGGSSAVVFTNDTLIQRYGTPDSSSRSASGSTPAPGSDPGRTDTAETPKTDEAPKTGMSAEERTSRISEIESQIERLEKRTLAIRNPLLAGTVPATEEEQENEEGMSAPDKLQAVEDQIAKLREELQKLQSGR